MESGLASLQEIHAVFDPISMLLKLVNQKGQSQTEGINDFLKVTNNPNNNLIYCFLNAQ